MSITFSNLLPPNYDVNNASVSNDHASDNSVTTGTIQGGDEQSWTRQQDGTFLSDTTPPLVAILLRQDTNDSGNNYELVPINGNVGPVDGSTSGHNYVAGTDGKVYQQSIAGEWVAVGEFDETTGTFIITHANAAIPKDSHLVQDQNGSLVLVNTVDVEAITPIMFGETIQSHDESRTLVYIESETGNGRWVDAEIPIPETVDDPTFIFTIEINGQRWDKQDDNSYKNEKTGEIRILARNDAGDQVLLLPERFIDEIGGEEYAVGYDGTLYQKTDAGDWEQVSDNAQKVFDQMNAVLADNEISITELNAPENAELADYIVNDLGYTSIGEFVTVHGWRTKTRISTNDTQIPLETVSKEAIEASILGSLNNGGFRLSVNENEDLPNDLDGNLTFVELTLHDGQKVTFDGPFAGKAANTFANIYNNSETFAESMHQLLTDHNGNYPFHLIPLQPNTTGTNTAASGVFINSTRADRPNGGLMRTMIHEVTHDIQQGHDHDHEDDEHLVDAGHSHARGQSLFLSTVINEIEESGFNTKINVDRDDYSADTLVFSDDYKPDHKTVRSDPPGDFEHYQDLFNEIREAINAGNFDQALAFLQYIGPNTTIDLSFKLPNGAGWTDPESFNVYTLFFQELMFLADSNDRFNTQNSLVDKTKLANFFTRLVYSDDSFKDIINTAAEEIHYNLETELPLYAYAPPEEDE